MSAPPRRPCHYDSQPRPWLAPRPRPAKVTLPHVMINWLIKKVIGSKNARMVKSLAPLVARINQLESEYQALSDDELRAKVAGWKAEISAIEDYEERERKLEEVLPEAFAAVKNAARRMNDRQMSFTVCDMPVSWYMVHFDVQLIGGICLHRGMISEMATGEGKTLVATLALFLNALSGRGAHLVTTNDYLARRDAEWMGQIYGFLGLKTGVIQHDQTPDVRREQYTADITYGMNSEFGFDYLRDNGMATSKEQQVQRGHHFGIVDEVDSILIDEARVPLIISGPAMVTHDEQYGQFKPQVESIFSTQERLCNRFLSEAEELLRQLRPEDGSNPKNAEAVERQIGLLLYRVKMGQPTSEGLMKLLELPENVRLMNAAELQLHADQ